jgi:hypothetical protein
MTKQAHGRLPVMGHLASDKPAAAVTTAAQPKGRAREFYVAIRSDGVDVVLERIPHAGAETDEVWLWAHGVDAAPGPVVLARKHAAALLQGLLNWATEDVAWALERLPAAGAVSEAARDALMNA